MGRQIEKCVVIETKFGFNSLDIVSILYFPNVSIALAIYTVQHSVAAWVSVAVYTYIYTIPCML